MKLYKYRKVGESGSWERTALRDILCNHKLWFARPSTFEDELDCRPKVAIRSMETMKKWLEHRYKDLQSRGKAQKIDIDEFLVQHTDEQWMEDRWFHVADSITGVCCLSDSPSIDSQWKDYGDAYSGVCIEIDTSQNLAGAQVRPVSYTDSRPIVFMDQFVTDLSYRDTVTFEVLITQTKKWA